MQIFIKNNLIITSNQYFQQFIYESKGIISPLEKSQNFPQFSVRETFQWNIDVKNHQCRTTAKSSSLREIPAIFKERKPARDHHWWLRERLATYCRILLYSPRCQFGMKMRNCFSRAAVCWTMDKEGGDGWAGEGSRTSANYTIGMLGNNKTNTISNFSVAGFVSTRRTK